MQMLRREHNNTLALLDVLEYQIDLMNEARYYEIIDRIIDYCLSYPDKYHHPKEDLIYEKLLARDPATAAIVGNLLAEHEQLAEKTHEVAASRERPNSEVTNDSLRRGLGEFVDAYRRHILTEEQHFFSRSLKLLVDEDWDEIQAQITNGDDPLFGDRIAERFQALHTYIHALDRIDREP